jgi:hypothetical protein
MTDPSVALFYAVRATLPGTRPGILGMCLDCGHGAELDRIGALYFINVKREPARLFGLRLPWGQRDETYRERIWQAAQSGWLRRF